jgi:hypothetical protein
MGDFGGGSATGVYCIPSTVTVSSGVVSNRYKLCRVQQLTTVAQCHGDQLLLELVVYSSNTYSIQYACCVYYRI